MAFSSVLFLFFFLPLALAVYFIPCGSRRGNIRLLALSLLFYAWTEREYTAVLVASIAINYFIALALSRANRAGGAFSAKLIFAFGVAANLGLLIFFKYFNFLAENIHLAMQWADAGSFVPAKIYAPIGISFFTFHALSYLTDVYRKDAAALKNPLDVGLYLSLFPKILAGPIIRFRDAQKQLGARPADTARIASGIERFVVGLAKKILLANPLAAAADKIFAFPANELTFPVAWLGALCFTLQIYFDFSGYSDMAIGLGRIFGFDLPENFNYPYVSQSVQEFWRRWHMTLSGWFRDYLYIPLGGNRRGVRRQYFNLITVFLLCGLWHGASWTFILWGLWYGLFLVLERAGLNRLLQAAWRPLRHIYVLAVVMLGWVLFRADSLGLAFAWMKALFGLGTGTGEHCYPAVFLNGEIILCLCAGVLASLPLGSALRGRFRSAAASGAFSTGISSAYVLVLGVLFFLSCAAMAGGTQKSFIYFKF